MAVMLTYFVHGTTTDNENGLATGWMPGKLSDLGIMQAKELGRILSAKRFDIVFCSDLKRAVDSAKLIFGNKYEIVQDERLRECNYGDFTGMPSSDFKERMQDYVEIPFPNGESYKDVEKRILDFLCFLKKNYDGKRIAIVSHQAPQLALEVLLKGKTWEDAIESDWRKNGEWKPGWDYILE